MKNVPFMKMFNVKASGLAMVNLQILPEMGNFLEEMLFCVYDENTAILFILSV